MTDTTLDHTLKPNNNKLRHIPGDYGWPILGKNIQLVSDLPGLAREHFAKYGPLSRIDLAMQKGLLALGPDLSQELLLDKDKVFSSKMGYARSLKPFFGEGLLLHDFDEHRFQRRILQTGFKTPAMRGYVDIMNPVLEQGIDAWRSQKDFHFYPNIKKLLLHMALKVFYGIEENSSETDKLSQAFIDCTDGQLGLFQVDKPGFKFHRGKNGSRYLRAYIKKLIPERRNGEGHDMLSYMCKETKPDGSYFSDEEIVDHAGFLLFAAHDTTTSTLTHMAYYLARHPEWQERLRSEGREISTAPLQYEQLDAAEQLGWVFHESQRLHPSVSVMVRRTTRDISLAGFPVPAHTMIYMIPMFTNRMKEYWSKPDGFDPARFSEQRAEHKNHSFCFMPFGGGAHKCIGMHFGAMQAKLFTHQFLQRFDISLPDNYQAEFQTVPLPKLKDDLPLRLTERQN